MRADIFIWIPKKGARKMCTDRKQRLTTATSFPFPFCRQVEENRREYSKLEGLFVNLLDRLPVLWTANNQFYKEVTVDSDSALGFLPSCFYIIWLSLHFWHIAHAVCILLLTFLILIHSTIKLLAKVLAKAKSWKRDMF